MERNRTERGWREWAALVVILILTAAVRLRLLDIPLERDEGEYAYAGQLMLEGVPPYQLAYNMKPPGTYATYALIMTVFGQTPRGIRLGLLIANAATIVLVFKLGRRIFDRGTGLFAAAAYAVLSVSPSILGPFAHASHLIVLAALGGILLLVKATGSGRLRILFGSGFLLGLSLLMKQHAALFLGFGAVYLGLAQIAGRRWSLARCAAQWGVYSLGAALPVLLACAGLHAAGTYDNFWFWTVQYAREYASEVSLLEASAYFPKALAIAVGPAAFMWILAALGVPALFLDGQARAGRSFLLPFTVFSFLAVCPGLYFREHYFIVFLPAVALLAGVAAMSAGRFLSHGRRPALQLLAPVLLFGGAAGYQVYGQKEFLFFMSPAEASRSRYGPNPFPEAAVIGDYIKAHTDEKDSVAVLGSEPEVYFYSHRRSATGYIYTYGLMEPQKYALRMQEEMIREIEAARPKFVVLVKVPLSWLIRPASERRILKWIEAYSQEHYELEGIVEILSMDRTEYRWGRDAAGYTPRSENYLAILRRRAL